MTSRARLSLTSMIAACGLGLATPAHSAPPEACSVTPTSPLVVNVKDIGAKGDGKANDTRAIQNAIDKVTGTGGTVYVPDGVYLVEPHGKNHLQLRSKMTLKLADRAVIKVLPNASIKYAALTISQASDVTVVGGTLQGDRAEHKAKKGEWGMGIWIGPDADRVTVVGVTAKDMWGDGFYVGGAADVAFCSVVASHNRRQGLSIVSAKRLLVTGSVFRDTRGTRPSAGIDIEPDRPTETVTDVRIERSKFINNAGGGIMIAGKKGEVADVEISHNVFEEGRPVLVENAPRVRSTKICNNRHVAQREQPAEGFNSFAEPVEIVALQTDCSEGRDLRFEMKRQTKKKKKPQKPAN